MKQTLLVVIALLLVFAVPPLLLEFVHPYAALCYLWVWMMLIGGRKQDK